MKPTLIGALLLLSTCDGGIKPNAIEKTTNTQVDVSMLFEHDGCRVYRFSDDRRFVYYVRCASSSWAQSSHSESCGKNCTKTVDDGPVQTVYDAFPLPEKKPK